MLNTLQWLIEATLAAVCVATPERAPTSLLGGAHAQADCTILVLDPPGWPLLERRHRRGKSHAKSALEGDDVGSFERLLMQMDLSRLG